jgi:hypothetical protein
VLNLHLARSVDIAMVAKAGGARQDTAALRAIKIG